MLALVKSSINVNTKVEDQKPANANIRDQRPTNAETRG